MQMFFRISNVRSAWRWVASLAAVLMLVAGQTQAHTSIAVIRSHSETNYAYWGAANSKEADAEALKGCRKAAARIKGLPRDAKCVIVVRTNEPGYGAIVCGDGDCFFEIGASTRNRAIEAALKSCIASGISNCNEPENVNWEDRVAERVAREAPEAHFVANNRAQCSPPAGKVVHSKTKCNNGDCIRTFENGCQVHFNAPYCLDPANGTWSWKPDGCN